MTTRLHTKFPTLADKILGASPKLLDQLVKIAGHIAIDNAGLDLSMANEVRVAIDNKTLLEVNVRLRLEELQEAADNAYLDVHDTLASHEPLPNEARTWFRQARALAAILASVEAVDAAAVTEIVYEAIFSCLDEKSAAETIERAV